MHAFPSFFLLEKLINNQVLAQDEQRHATQDINNKAHGVVYR